MALAPIDPVKGDQASWLGFTVNLLMFLSQCPLMWRMARDPSPASRAKYSFVPSLGLGATTGCWLAYSINSLPTAPVVAINALGYAIALAYACVFLYARPTRRGKAVVAAAFGGLSAAIALVYGALYGSRFGHAQEVASAFTIVVNVTLWASPLQALWLAAKELDTKRVSVPLTLTQAVAASTWTAAGFLLGDVTLVITSMIGVVLTPVQLGAIGWIWWRRRHLSEADVAALVARNAAATADTAAAAAAVAGLDKGSRRELRTAGMSERPLEGVVGASTVAGDASSGDVEAASTVSAGSVSTSASGASLASSAPAR